MMRPGNRPHRRQRGVVLVVALIMLLLMTLIAVTSANITQTNLKVVQNIESREMVMLAARAAFEEAISSNQFTSTPGNIFLNNCTQANEKCYDINGDATADVTVQVANPTCVQVAPIRNAELQVFTSAEDASCFLPPGEFSMCSESVWEFRAEARDVSTGTVVNVRQGVSVRATNNNIATVCPT